MKIEDVELSFVPELGDGGVAHLIDIFTDAQAIFAAPQQRLVEVAQLRGDIAEHIAQRRSLAAAQRQVEYAARRGVRMVAATERSYPERLSATSSAPHIIYMVGQGDIAECRTIIGFAGNRDMSSYAEQMCVAMVERLAEQCPEVVIAGALEGIADGVALRAAMHFGLRVIAVSSSPLTKIVSSHLAHLAQEVISSGGLIVGREGEFSPCKATEGDAARLMAALCDAVVVLEASHIPAVAAAASSYGRELFALPGRATDGASSMANRMIATGEAQMVCSAEDILRLLDLE